MNETHCSYGYYQDTSEYVKKIGGHHASFNATGYGCPILHRQI